MLSRTENLICQAALLAPCKAYLQTAEGSDLEFGFYQRLCSVENTCADDRCSRNQLSCAMRRYLSVETSSSRMITLSDRCTSRRIDSVLCTISSITFVADFELTLKQTNWLRLDRTGLSAYRRSTDGIHWFLVLTAWVTHL
jgi:hypothetical protein